MALDRNKPYGEVFGFASHRYEQDGKKFGPDGSEITDKTVKAPRPQSTKADPAPDQVAAQLKGE